MVPCRLEFQASVICAKWPSARRPRWQHGGWNYFSLRRGCGYNLLPILFGGYRATLQSHFIEEAIERVVTKLYRPAYPGGKSILRLPHPADDERLVICLPEVASYVEMPRFLA